MSSRHASIPTAGRALRAADVCALMDSHGAGLCLGPQACAREQNMRGDGRLLTRSLQVPSPLSHEWVCQEGTRGGQGTVTGQMGCGVNWEKTDRPPRGGQPHILDLSGHRPLQQNSKDWEGECRRQGRAPAFPQYGPVSGWCRCWTVTRLNQQGTGQ